VPDQPDCDVPVFDVVVLGGGTAGVHVAAGLAWPGRTVAMVEGHLIGGEGPYLAGASPASLLHSARRGEAWEHAVARRDERASLLDDARHVAALEEAGVTVLRRPGRVVRPGAVDVDGAEYGYTDLVLCTGAEPIRPDLPGLAEAPTWTIDEALRSPDLPRRLAVLGGDSEACELAQVYAAFGSQVTVVDERDRLLATEAPFVGDLVGEALRRTGAEVRVETGLEGVEPTATGCGLRLRDGGTIDVDRILLATRRRPRLDGLGLETLDLDAEAGLPVDDTCQVTRHVWAAGGVTGGPPSTHAAVYQAGVVVDNILGNRRVADYRAIPRAVHTTPSAYAVGRSPGDDGNLITAGCDLSTIARAHLDDDRGRLELYANRGDGVLIGAAAVGPYAEEWMSEITLAIRAEIPVTTLTEVVHAFPTYGEVIGAALRDLMERL
jgi:pyruvate/2-oxoglutarate dehydrogenase complex dihydrolipoamide dehydrogenase (E3) component